MPAMTGNRIRVNGASLYYEEQGAGEPIVGIHGTGSSAAMWAEAAPELATRGRVVLYDRRGSSRSERPEPYATNVREQADDAAALIDALGAAPAIVIGRSYGGAVALDLALRYPDRVRALVQLEGDGGLSMSKAAMRTTDELTKEVLAAAESDLGRVGERLLRSAFGDAGWEGLPEEVQQMFTDNGPAIVAELRGGFPRVTAAELASVDKPTLLVVARDSAWRREYEDLTRLTAAALPQARVDWVDGGHAVDPAHPVVLGFVDEVLAREALS